MQRRQPPPDPNLDLSKCRTVQIAPPPPERPVATREEEKSAAAAEEEHIRSTGKHLIVGGATFTVTTFILTLTWHAGFGSFMPASYHLPLYALGLGAALVGCLERITRHSRAQVFAIERRLEAAEKASERAEAAILRLVPLLSEELRQAYYRGGAETAQDISAATTRVAPGRPVNWPAQSADVYSLRARNDRTG